MWLWISFLGELAVLSDALSFFLHLFFQLRVVSENLILNSPYTLHSKRYKVICMEEKKSSIVRTYPLENERIWFPIKGPIEAIKVHGIRISL